MPESGGDSDTGKCISNIRGGANPVSLRSTAPSRGRGENVGRFKCIDPSFLWKEVPAGRRLGAQSGVKKERLKSTIYESTLSTADAVPLPRWGRLRGATLRVNFYKGRCPKVVGIAIRGKRISNIRGEPTPSRYAGQPLPEEGARMWDVSSVSIPPSFGRRCPQGGG